MSRTKHHGDKAKAKLLGGAWRWTSANPGWWSRMMHTKPQRRAGAVWEASLGLDGLEGVDDPPHGRKPHVYFW